MQGLYLDTKYSASFITEALSLAQEAEFPDDIDFLEYFSVKSERLSEYSTNPNDDTMSNISFSLENLIPEEEISNQNFNFSELTSLETTSGVSFNSAVLPLTFNAIGYYGGTIEYENSNVEEIAALIEDISNDETICSEIDNHISSLPLETPSNSDENLHNDEYILPLKPNSNESLSPSEMPTNYGTLLSEDFDENEANSRECFNSSGALLSISATQSARIGHNSNDEPTTYTDRQSHTQANGNPVQIMPPLQTTTIDFKACTSSNFNQNGDTTNNVLLSSGNLNSNDDLMPLDVLENCATNTSINDVSPSDPTTNSDTNAMESLNYQEIVALINDISNDEINFSQSINNEDFTSLDNEILINETNSPLATTNDISLASEHLNNNTKAAHSEVTGVCASVACNEVTSTSETTTNGKIISCASSNCNDVTSSSFQTATNAQIISSDGSNCKEISTHSDTAINNENSGIRTSPALLGEPVSSFTSSCNEVTSTFEAITREDSNEIITTLDKMTADKETILCDKLLISTEPSINTETIFKERSNSQSKFQPPHEVSSSSHLNITKVKVPHSGTMKAHFCVFCKTPKTNISRHLLLKHKSEKRIKAILKLPKKHNDRLKVLNRLRKEGDFLHNTSKSLNTGTLIVSRQQHATRKNDADHYVCCRHCRGFFSKLSLRTHLSNCGNNKKNDRTNLIASRILTQYIHETASEKLKTEIFPILKLDEITKVIRYDELIIKLGNHLAKKYSNAKQYENLRFKLRLLGRFKIALKKLRPEVNELPQIYKPHMLNDCKKAFLVTANWDNDLMRFKATSTAQCLSFIIKKCGFLLRAEFQNQNDLKENLEDFLSQWVDQIANLAHDSTGGDLVVPQGTENVADASVKNKTDEVTNQAQDDSNSSVESNSDAFDENCNAKEIRSARRKRTRQEKSPLRFSKIKRIRWTTKERDAITSAFGCLDELHKLPSLRECADVINKYLVLKKRTPPQIKSWIDNQRSKNTVNKRAEFDDSDASDESCSNSEEMTEKPTISRGSRGKRKIEETPSLVCKIKRLRWSQEEQDAITSIFGCLKSLEKLPSLMECTDVINRIPILMNRTAPQLKSWIDNQRRYK